MTISLERNRSGPYAGTGINTTFPYRFRIDDKSHLRVVKVQADGAERALALGSEYGVTGVGNRAGGNVVLVQPLALGTSLLIVRDQPFTQGLDLVNQGPFFAEDVERGFDHSVMRDQELAERLSRAVTVPLGENSDPKDYLAQIKALLAQALAAVEGGSEISVLSHGAKGDRVTNDLAAFQAARDRAVELGLDRVIVPVPPDPDDWYFLLGEIEGVADVIWQVDPRAAINGSTNLFAEQRKIEGAQFWNPPIEQYVLKPVDAFYTHQAKQGMDLDGEWMVTDQFNLLYAAESADQQEVGYYRSQDGGQGAVWGDLIRFATNAAVCTNPIPMDGEAEGQRFTLWRTGVINFAQAGFGQKLWIRYGHGGGSTQGAFGIAQKTEAEGMHTLYAFHQLADGTIKPIRFGDEPPAGATFNSWRHEGKGNLFPICHDEFFSSSGRLHLLMLLRDRVGKDGAIMACVLYCDNPGADIDDMVWTLGPSMDLGDMDIGNYWEWSIAEQAPGWFIVMMRRNESAMGAIPQEGQRHFVAFGDGVSFSGWKPSGIHANRDRPSLTRLNHEHIAYLTTDEPTSRANPAIYLRRRDGGFAPALTVDSNEPFLRRKLTIYPESAKDTIWVPEDEDDNTIGLTGNAVYVTHYASSEDRVALDGEGYIANWSQQTLNLGHVDFSAGDVLYGRTDWRRETLFVDGGANTLFDLEMDLTAGTPLVEAFPAGEPLTVGVNVAVDTVNDRLTFTGSATDVEYLEITQSGAEDSKLFLSAKDTIWNLSADSSLTIAVGSFEAVLAEGGDTEFVNDVPELDFIVATAAGNVTLLLDEKSSSDRFVLDLKGGNQAHVPTAGRHPVTGDLLVAWAGGPTAGPKGGKGLEVAILRAEDFPRTDKLNVIPRRNAAAEYADEGHTYVWSESTRILECKGMFSAGVDLPAGRWQVSGRMRLSELPTVRNNAALLQVGNFEKVLSLEAVWRSPHLTRDLYYIERAAGPRDVSRGSSLSRALIDGVVESGGVYSLADDVWVGWTFRYDSYRSEVNMEGQTLPLQWPFVLTLGDGYLTSFAPTTRSLFHDIGSIVIREVPEPHREWVAPRAKPYAPNIIPGSGFAVERLRDGGRFNIGSPRAGVPGWTLYDDGGATVTWEQGKNSVGAANRELGAWPWSLRLNVKNVVRQPETEVTGPVRFCLSWPNALSVPSGEWFLQLDAIDQLDSSETHAARPAGLPVQVFWFHDCGGPLGKRLYSPVYPLRILRQRQTFAIPLPVPFIRDEPNFIIHPDSSCGIEFRVAAGYNCELQITKPQFFQGDAPRDWSPPNPYDPDETRRLFYELQAGTIGGSVAQGHMVNASVAEYLIDLPDMIAPPSLRTEGKFATEHNGTLHTGTPVLAEATDERALLRMTAAGATLGIGDAVSLKGVSALTLDQSGDAARIVDLEGFTVDDEDEVTVKKITSGGSTVDMSLYSDYGLRPGFEREWDRLQGASGSSLLTTDLSLPGGLTAINLLRFSETGGEESLVLGSGGWTADIPDEGDATFTLLDAGGTGLAMVSGHEYEAHLNFRRTAPQVIQFSQLGSGTVRITHSEDSDAALQFDARDDRPVWDAPVAATALFDAFTTSAKGPRKDLISRTIRALQDEGIWDALDVLHVMAAHDEQAASLNWIAPAGDAVITAVNAPVFTADRGYATDGVTSYAEVDYIVGTDSTVYAQDDASLFAWVFSSDGGALGGAIAGGYYTMIKPDNAGDSSLYLNGDVQVTGPRIRSDEQTGYYAVDRSGASDFLYLAQGQHETLRRVSCTNTSTGIPLGRLRWGRAGANYGATEFAWAGLGRSMTPAKHRALVRIMTRYLYGVGVLP